MDFCVGGDAYYFVVEFVAEVFGVDEDVVGVFDEFWAEGEGVWG